MSPGTAVGSFFTSCGGEEAKSGPEKGLQQVQATSGVLTNVACQGPATRSQFPGQYVLRIWH